MRFKREKNSETQQKKKMNDLRERFEKHSQMLVAAKERWKASIKDNSFQEDRDYMESISKEFEERKKKKREQEKEASLLSFRRARDPHLSHSPREGLSASSTFERNRHTTVLTTMNKTSNTFRVVGPQDDVFEEL